MATGIAGFLVGIPAGLLDIGTLSDLSNIGTLFAFVLVSIGVIILRVREPGDIAASAPRADLNPVSIAFCALLMAGLPIMTWLRFFGWLIIGLVIYVLLPQTQRVRRRLVDTVRAALRSPSILQCFVLSTERVAL